MGSIYQEFEKRLAEGKHRWADRPREEMLDLFLLALEREEIVAIGYRENAIARRLTAMPIPQDVREILRHALVWAWKDEEMHAIYIRGAILRLGGFNVDAEKTAWLCWHRIRALAEHDSALPATLVGDFARIELDEQRHGARRWTIRWEAADASLS